MTRLQRWTIAGAAIIALGVLECADPPPTHHDKETCIDRKTGKEVECKGPVVP